MYQSDLSREKDYTLCQAKKNQNKTKTNKQTKRTKHIIIKTKTKTHKKIKKQTTNKQENNQ